MKGRSAAVLTLLIKFHSTKKHIASHVITAQGRLSINDISFPMFLNMFLIVGLLHNSEVCSKIHSTPQKKLIIFSKA